MEILDKIKIFKQHNKLIITILLLATILLCVSISIASTYAVANADNFYFQHEIIEDTTYTSSIPDPCDPKHPCYKSSYYFTCKDINNVIFRLIGQRKIGNTTHSFEEDVKPQSIYGEKWKNIKLVSYHIEGDDPNGVGFYIEIKQCDGYQKVYIIDLGDWSKKVTDGKILAFTNKNKFDIHYFVNNELYETAEINPNEQAQNLEMKEAGYNFTQWYEDEACTVLYDFSNPVTNDLNLYCKKSEQKTTVTITFYVDGEIYKQIEAPYGCMLVNQANSDV